MFVFNYAKHSNYFRTLRSRFRASEQILFKARFLIFEKIAFLKILRECLNLVISGLRWKRRASRQAGMWTSVRQMKAGMAARTPVVALTPAAEARSKVGVSQLEFPPPPLGVSVRTLQDWEQGRRTHSGAAKTRGR